MIVQDPRLSGIQPPAGGVHPIEYMRKLSAMQGQRPQVSVPGRRVSVNADLEAGPGVYLPPQANAAIPPHLRRDSAAEPLKKKDNTAMLWWILIFIVVAIIGCLFLFRAKIFGTKKRGLFGRKKEPQGVFETVADTFRAESESTCLSTIAWIAGPILAVGGICVGYYYWNNVLSFFGLKSKGEAKFDDFGDKCSEIVGDERATEARTACITKLRECAKEKDDLTLQNASKLRANREDLEKCMTELEDLHKTSKSEFDAKNKKTKEEKAKMHEILAKKNLRKSDMESVDDVCTYDYADGKVLSQRMKRHAKGPLSKHISDYTSKIYQYKFARKDESFLKWKNQFVRCLDVIFGIPRWILDWITPGFCREAKNSLLTPSKWEVPWLHNISYFDGVSTRREVKREIDTFINTLDPTLNTNRELKTRPEDFMAEFLTDVKDKTQKWIPGTDLQLPSWLCPFRKTAYYNRLWADLMKDRTPDKKGAGDLYDNLYTLPGDSSFKSTKCTRDYVKKDYNSIGSSFWNAWTEQKARLAPTLNMKKKYLDTYKDTTCRNGATKGIKNALRVLKDNKRTLSKVGNDGTDSAMWDDYYTRLQDCGIKVDRYSEHVK